jgi:predicted RNase H-like nuclease
MEVVVEKHGVDAFLFGPPSGVEKIHNAHRDYCIPKLASTMEFAAKKLRE